MNRERIEMAKRIVQLNTQQLREQGHSSPPAEAAPHIIDDVMQTVAGLTSEELGAALREISAEAHAVNTLAQKLQALGDRLGVEPRLNIRANVKRWADTGDPEATELLASGALDAVRLP